MLSSLKKIVPRWLVNYYHFLQAFFAATYFGFPSRQLIVIGITGTNGKTTACNLIAKILEEEGHKIGLATTINFQIGKKKWVNKTKMTTLSSWQTQSLLARMVKAKCRYAIIETSSHAIDQNRIWGIDYDIVGITNLTREHLDYHQDMENYLSAKEKIFSRLSGYYKKKKVRKTAIYNLQDSSWRTLIKHPAGKKYAFSLTNQSKIKLSRYPKTILIHASDVQTTEQSTTFKLHTPHYQKEITMKLLGKFNVQNALLASCVARSQKIKLKTIKSALEKIDYIPGRLEKIDIGQPFSVYIDYAVTPDSLLKLYRDIIKPIASQKIIAVFGSCGDRDQGKRPQMGEIVAEFADYIILTHEDSWTENPDEIISQIVPGIEKTGKKINQDFFIIPDRKEAIHKAFTLAQPDDIVVLTGKGAETKMVFPDRIIDWSERRIAEELLTEIMQTAKI